MHTNFVSWYWQKKKKKKTSYAFWKQTYLLHSFNKLLLIYIYIYASYNTLISHNVNLLYNLKSKIYIYFYYLFYKVRLRSRGCAKWLY